MSAPNELVGVTCDYDTEGAPCYLWTGHYGLHQSEGHDSHCLDCGTCICSPADDCWVEEVSDDAMVAVRLSRHHFVKDSGTPAVNHQPKGYREPHPVTGSGRLCSTCLRRRPANG